ncbi:hypothetical protein [Amycolatopsis sp. BJA-103]|uniref:hypothetical protein n=1 Tax=Amycolatopsis sp. BJA-103 TaxID=1911175 RepID=UPI0011AFC493|nr:hypothetical protein [Amycolatopsis sp. BJA-103]
MADKGAGKPSSFNESPPASGGHYDGFGELRDAVAELINLPGGGEAGIGNHPVADRWHELGQAFGSAIDVLESVNEGFHKEIKRAVEDARFAGESGTAFENYAGRIFRESRSVLSVLNGGRMPYSYEVGDVGHDIKVFAEGWWDTYKEGKRSINESRSPAELRTAQKTMILGLLKLLSELSGKYSTRGQELVPFEPVTGAAGSGGGSGGGSGSGSNKGSGSSKGSDSSKGGGSNNKGSDSNNKGGSNSKGGSGNAGGGGNDTDAEQEKAAQEEADEALRKLREGDVGTGGTESSGGGAGSSQAKKQTQSDGPNSQGGGSGSGGAQEKAAQEKAAQEKAAQEKAAQGQAAQGQAAQEKAAAGQAAQEKAAQEKAAQEKAAQEQAKQEADEVLRKLGEGNGGTGGETGGTGPSGGGAGNFQDKKQTQSGGPNSKGGGSGSGAAQEKAAQEKAAQEKAAQEKAAQEKAAQEKAAQEKAKQEALDALDKLRNGDPAQDKAIDDAKDAIEKRFGDDKKDKPGDAEVDPKALEKAKGGAQDVLKELGKNDLTPEQQKALEQAKKDIGGMSPDDDPKDLAKAKQDALDALDKLRNDDPGLNKAIDDAKDAIKDQFDEALGKDRGGSGDGHSMPDPRTVDRAADEATDALDDAAERKLNPEQQGAVEHARDALDDLREAKTPEELAQAKEDLSAALDKVGKSIDDPAVRHEIEEAKKAVTGLGEHEPLSTNQMKTLGAVEKEALSAIDDLGKDTDDPARQQAFEDAKEAVRKSIGHIGPEDLNLRTSGGGGSSGGGGGDHYKSTGSNGNGTSDLDDYLRGKGQHNSQYNGNQGSGNQSSGNQGGGNQGGGNQGGGNGYGRGSDATRFDVAAKQSLGAMTGQQGGQQVTSTFPGSSSGAPPMGMPMGGMGGGMGGGGGAQNQGRESQIWVQADPTVWEDTADKPTPVIGKGGTEQ